MKKMSEQKFYTRYNPPPKVSVKFSKPSLTQQQFKQECDINTIIASVDSAGVINNPLWNGTRRPMYGDFSGIQDMDYLQAQNMFLDASARFMELPAKVRQQFNNNPAELLSYLQSNPPVEELAKLGFADIPPKVEDPAASSSGGVSKGEPAASFSGGVSKGEPAASFSGGVSKGEPAGSSSGGVPKDEK